MPSINLTGTVLAYEVQGMGRTLVFLHAGIADMHMWDDQFSYFAKEYQVIRYDQRGFGSTPYGDAEFSYADDLLVLLDHLAVKDAVLVGCSLGGMVALEFALSYPERVQGIVLVGSSINGYTPTAPQPPQWEEARKSFERGDFDKVVELAVQVFARGGGRSEQQVPNSISEYVGTHYRRSIEVQHDPTKSKWLDPPAAQRLHEIQTPTLVIWGSLDTEQIIEMGDALVQNLPNARKETIEGTAHLPSMEFPATFNQLVEEFAASLR